MIANLYIVKQSFDCSGIPLMKVKGMLEEFCQMVNYSVKGADGANNKYIVSKPDFMESRISDSLTVRDLLNFSDNAKESLGYDFLTNFIGVFNKFKNSIESCSVTCLPASSKDEAHALCVLQHSEQFPKNSQIIANIRELGKFRCHHFIECPDSDGYFEEADNYMRGLSLHPDIKRTYKKVFASHKNKIDKCLWVMEEHYLSYFKNFEGSAVNCVSKFAREYNLYDGGSYEGSSKLKREKLHFQSRSECVYCEPHLKMNTDDRGKRNYCRIYFEEPRHSLCKVYIGYICEHK